VSKQMNKITNEVISSLKKLPAPDKKTGAFWDFMKGQLSEEGTWSQNHLKVIEKEIGTQLDKLDNKTLADLWKDLDVAGEKLDSNKKVDDKEMKEDLTEELVGQVMDNMDDNYSSRDSYFTESTYVESTNNKEEDEGFDEDVEPDKIKDEELDLNDDELFNDDFDEEDDSTF
jgi:hypothetical protein